MASQLTDAFAHKFYYLHLSITNVCNFHCTYCLPDGYKPSSITNKGFLTINEIHQVTRAFASLGTKKVRLTGSEPSLHHDFTNIITTVQENDTIHQIAVTTNGYHLEHNVANWHNAGLTGINISVDSLDTHQFHTITRQDKFNQVMAGINAAFEASFEKVKVNTMLIHDVNHHQLNTFLNWIQHHPIQLHFIKLMETGKGSKLFHKHHISGQVLHDKLLHHSWIHQLHQHSNSPTQVFCHPDYTREIGLIMPYEKDFCATCNHLHVSSIGKLHLCLFGEGSINLHDLLEDNTQQQALEARISAALQEKKQTHFLHQNNTSITQNLSYIGS